MFKNKPYKINRIKCADFGEQIHFYHQQPYRLFPSFNSHSVGLFLAKLKFYLVDLYVDDFDPFRVEYCELFFEYFIEEI